MPDNLFPACYFPPIPWYVAALRQKTIYLDGALPYRKQQLSSRTHIKVANRTLPLTLPVERRDRHHPLIEKKVSFAERWPHQHWMSLRSAYANSPYFEFYGDELATLLQQRHAYLHQWLTASTRWGLASLGWEGKVEWVNKLPKEELSATSDYRNSFDPTLRDLPSWFVPKPYPQVFEGFTPGLSIIDLILNLGPEAPSYLKSTWQKPADGLLEGSND